MDYGFEKPVKGIICSEKYQCTIEWRSGTIIADEPLSSGGKDNGPDPYTLLLSSLASCTLITLRMYIDRKGWEIPEIAVNVNLFRETKEQKTNTIIDRDIVFFSPVEDEQKMRLVEIAKQCPISKILEGDIKVRSFVFKEGENEKKINYANDEITVVWKPGICQHAQRCWRQLPEVFDYKKKQWIEPNGASAENIMEQVKKCPSGALSYFPTKEKQPGKF